jgi:hypothetical protein
MVDSQDEDFRLYPLEPDRPALAGPHVGLLRRPACCELLTLSRVQRHGGGAGDTPMPTPSTERVPEHTAAHVNHDIHQATLQNVAKYAAGGPAIIEWRLDALAREWDIERALEANAAVFALLGLALAAFFNWWWLLLPFTVAFFLLVHAVWGWCPPIPILRRLGLRTRAEIDYERYALKNLRGDFTSLPKAPPERVDMYQAEQVLAAVMK